MSNDTLESLQTQIAFLERANAELGDVVYRQQQQIDQLAAQVRTLSDRMSAAQVADHERTPEQERPPHY